MYLFFFSVNPITDFLRMGNQSTGSHGTNHCRPTAYSPGQQPIPAGCSNGMAQTCYSQGVMDGLQGATPTAAKNPFCSEYKTTDYCYRVGVTHGNLERDRAKYDAGLTQASFAHSDTAKAIASVRATGHGHTVATRMAIDNKKR